jgi:hypothetical protein
MEMIISMGNAVAADGSGSEMGSQVTVILIYVVFCVLLIVLRRVATLALGLAGLFVGGIAGFLFRPSAPSLGRLPLEYVITRGASAEGLDQNLVLVAHESFNLVLAGAGLGAGIGAIIGYWWLHKRSQDQNPRPD